MKTLLTLAAVLVALPRLAVGQEVIRADPESYLRLLPGLRAGQTLELSPGSYRGGLPVHYLQGEPHKPIVIRGAHGSDKPRFFARGGHNTVSIVDSRHVIISGLHLDGSNLIADAVKAEGNARFAHDITVEDLVIVGHGVDQSIVGISTMCPAWNWTIRGNLIVGAGTGMYLGHSSGSRPFIGGVIEHNVVVDTIGYNLQLKQQGRRAAELPANRSVTVIRNNVFSKAAGGSTGSRARPNVWLGRPPRDGPGREDLYAVYGNFFYDNAHGPLLEAEGAVAVYRNAFVNPHGDAIRILARGPAPNDVRIAFNTIIAAREGLVVNAESGNAATVVGNLYFVGQRPTRADGIGNAVQSYESWKRVQPKGADLPLDPASWVVPTDAITFDTTLLSDLPDWNRDFDGTRVRAWLPGAHAGREPGWHWRLQRKPQWSATAP